MTDTLGVPVAGQQFYAVDGRKQSPEQIEQRARADAQRKHADYARALDAELAEVQLRLEHARGLLDDAVAAHRRAGEEWEKGAALERVTEAGKPVTRLTERAAAIEAEIARHRKDKP